MLEGTLIPESEIHIYEDLRTKKDKIYENSSSTVVEHIFT
jgi:hypothetical protein